MSEYLIENEAHTREAVAKALEEAAAAVRRGEFRFVSLAMHIDDRPKPSMFVVTGPEENDYSGALESVGKLGVMLKRAQRQIYNPGGLN